MKSALWMAMMAAFVVLAVPVCAQCPGGRCRVTAGPVLASSAPVVWDAPVVRVSSVPVVAEPSHSTDMTAPPIIVPPYIPPACTGHPCGPPRPANSPCRTAWHHSISPKSSARTCDLS